MKSKFKNHQPRGAYITKNQMQPPIFMFSQAGELSEYYHRGDK